MKKRILRSAKQYVKQDRRRRNWRKLVRVMACVVVFCTTYAMILPAITLEKDHCSLTEHTHSESCYEKVLSESVAVLACDYDSLGVHEHESDCRDAEGNLICGEADYLVHTHSGKCLDANGVLVCRLPEVEEHEHTEDCYGVAETEPAETEAVATEPADPAEAESEPTEPESEPAEVLKLICGKEEIRLHSHDEEDCYETYLDEEGNEQKRLICTQVVVLEHKHGEDCYVTEEVPVENADVLTCTLAEGHVHGEGCYDETGDLICTETEGHVHGEMCYGTWKLICGLEEHTHDGECALQEETEPEAEPNTLRYRGGDYEVTVRYDDAAGIPENAQLAVRELSGEEYRTHLDRVYEELGIEGANTLIQLATEGVSFGDSGEDVAAVSGQIGFARFFDITILADGQEIEPKSPVEVTVSYDESVEIPDGEKIAVHFNHDGNVEILDAEAPKEPAVYAARSVTNTRQPQTENNENKNVFVFKQDSFSISATINLGGDDLAYQSLTSKTVYVENWPSESTVAKTLTIYAQFDKFTNEKTITVKVPTGFVIHSYSAKDGPSITDQLGAKLEIDGLYWDYVKSSSLEEASTHGTIAGTKWGTTWENQAITGYAGENSSTNASIRIYGGDIEWKLEKDTQTVLLQVNLSIQQELLSHTVNKEAMGDIVITIEDVQDGQTVKNVTTIKTTATGIPVAKMDRPDSGGGLEEYYASVKGITRDGKNLSDILPVSCSNYNYQGNASGNANSDRSYAEAATFVLTYPTGVYYEPDTAFCSLLGLKTITLINDNADHTVEGSNNHLKVKWEEKPGGGGTITWTLTNFMMDHFGGGEIMGASFRADTAVHKAGVPIEGFSFQMPSYKRNTFTRTNVDTVLYTRGLVDGDKKNIIIYPRNFTRRNMAKDFGKEVKGYDYVLGGFDVYSMLPYEDNVFYFTNPHGLKITGLNLMGKNIRDIIIYTTEGRTINVLDYLYDNDCYSKVDYIVDEMNGQKPEYYNEKWVYGYGSKWIPEVQAGSATGGALVELSRLGGKPGEYIAKCYFTVDTDQLTYLAKYTFSGFTYIGEFDESETAGREVYLQQLEDGTTYQAAVAGENYDGNKNKEVYDNPAIPLILKIEDDDVFGADHTTIGWTNTGVGAVATTSQHPYDDWGNYIKGQVYYPGQAISIRTYIESGYNMGSTANPITQNMLIDPVLIINLPKGISLDLESINLYRRNTEVDHRVEEVKTDTDTVVDGVKWTTYRITLDTTSDIKPYTLVAHERLIGATQLVSDVVMIQCYFTLVVSPQCTIYDLSLQDMVMWDVRNTGYAEDTLETVPEPGVSGDATESHWNHECVREDKYNFLRHGPQYAVANNGNSIEIKPLVGLITDLGIKRVDSPTADKTTTGFTTYDGQDSSIVSVKPGGYADVKLSYLSNGLTDFFEGTVIYVPIPKYGQNFGSDSLSYFQNINLDDPMMKTDYKPFGFTMDLTGPVYLDAEPDANGNKTQWTTYYAVDYSDSMRDYYIDQNKMLHEAVAAPNVDNWEPVKRYAKQNTYTYSVTWVDEQGMSDEGWEYADVRMVKFVATDGVVPAGGSGTAVMRLYVHDTTESGPANYGTYNYWRAYGKAVDNALTLQGQWSHTSVVAATPGGAETVVGQFFVEKTANGIFASNEPKYTGKNYTVKIYDSSGKESDEGYLNVDETGAFALVDELGRTAYLRPGSYTIKIQDNEAAFTFANSDASFGSLGKESSPYMWHNNVQGVDGGTATFNLTIGNGTQPVHYIGIGLSPVANVTIIGRKTIAGSAPLNAGDFTFVLRDSAGNEITRTTNNADGTFAFAPIEYTTSGTRNYIVTEEKGDSKFMTYDGFEHTVSVSIGWTSDGRLVSDVRYDNTDSAYELDRSTRDKAAFTNSVANAILQGQIFVDSDQDGLFESQNGEKPYKGQKRGNKITVTVSGPGLSSVPVTVNDDGSFALVDSEGKYVDLAPGSYTVTIVETDGSFMYANSSYLSSIGKESPSGSWRNNVSGTEYFGTAAARTTWKFTVTGTSTGTEIHRLGIALKSRVDKQLQAYKTFTGGTLNAGDFTFQFIPLNGAPISETLVSNNAYRYATTPTSIYYYIPGIYVYQIKEVTDNPKPGILYDGHTTTATVTVTEDADGVLSLTIKYDNSKATTASDRADTAKARFTNSVGYELPATGGAGTTSYTMGGLLMITAAILLYIHILKRRKEAPTSF